MKRRGKVERLKMRKRAREKRQRWRKREQKREEKLMALEVTNAELALHGEIASSLVSEAEEKMGELAVPMVTKKMGVEARLRKFCGRIFRRGG